MTENAAQGVDRSTVRAVERALDILLCFAEDDVQLGLTDIAKRVNLHKSTVHRLLASLEVKGFLRRQEQTDRYQLGWRILELSSHVFHSDDLSVLSLPEMTFLRDVLGETISLYIRIGSERIRIQAVESTQPVRRVANIGRRFPLYVGASGKVLLAFATDAELHDLKESGAFPSELSWEEFQEQLVTVRQNGYAVSIEEREVGAAAVAVPVFGRKHECIAALSVSGPVDRYPPEDVDRFAQTSREAAARISQLITH